MRVRPGSEFVLPSFLRTGFSAPNGNRDAHSSFSPLANILITYRFDLGLSPNAIDVGVAQGHADDMATHGYINFVGSDGEDVARRIVCSGGAPKNSLSIGYNNGYWLIIFQ